MWAGIPRHIRYILRSRRYRARSGSERTKMATNARTTRTTIANDTRPNALTPASHFPDLEVAGDVGKRLHDDARQHDQQQRLEQLHPFSSPSRRTPSLLR